MLHSNHVFEKNSGRKIEAKRKDIEALKFQLVEAQSFLLGMEEALKFVPEDDALNGHNGSFLRPGTDLAKSREAILNSGQGTSHQRNLEGYWKGSRQETARFPGGQSLLLRQRKKDIHQDGSCNVWFDRVGETGRGPGRVRCSPRKRIASRLADNKAAGGEPARYAPGVVCSSVSRIPHPAAFLQALP